MPVAFWDPASRRSWSRRAQRPGAAFRQTSNAHVLDMVLEPGRSRSRPFRPRTFASQRGLHSGAARVGKGSDLVRAAIYPLRYICRPTAKMAAFHPEPPFGCRPISDGYARGGDADRRTF